ncbi:MAG: SUMF1/EgtB/PvdO family nonheme iron enzyme [Bacteroidota bacterium]|nr:SUMF1/EgtB/PvdO family nonheme iron enzyme [Bacteroidota bacterium]MDP4206349.1 SUMF1/EgtB/PvdO family nonheme iron enzyme [Bacteroidota bacterium]
MRLQSFLLIALSISLLSSCSKKSSKNASSTTGWAYNDPQTGGFQSDGAYEQATGPGLAFIQGGTFIMGRVEEDVMHKGDNPPRRVTVASFYMDQTEVRNIDYREYLHWLRRVYPGNPEKYQTALPDTLVWREELAYNEPYINNYLRHPAYSNYPVVGVSWIQANDYCRWRTDRVNEKILIDRGILKPDPDQKGQNIFTTESYLAGMYNGAAGKTPMRDAKNTERRARWEDGFLLPNYRLPTEAEWEYAAYGLIGNADGELLSNRKIYPWNGATLRSPENKTKGQMMANFTRGRGDMMGMAGALNDNADIPAPVDSYAPNDYGLYCMAGNVNEWVADVYRPLSNLDVKEFQPYRGNVFTRYKKDAAGKLMRDQYGRLMVDTIADYRNFRDGSYDSQIVEGDNWVEKKDNLKTHNMYVQGKHAGEFSSLITDHARVYKGGSWKDRPYWLSPGTRRYLDENRSTSDLGFRCAMTRVGSPKGFKH